MKKIKPQSHTLLVLCAASHGGPTLSAINLLYLFRQEGRPFDVFLMDHAGVRTDDIAEQGHLLSPIPLLADAITSKSNLKTPAQYMRRIAFVLAHKVFGDARARKWLYQRAARHLNGKYKNVIAYQESMTSDFARFIEAPNRIAWMHTDYDKLRALSAHYASREVYDGYHHIASVTKASADRMIEVLGRDPDTVHTIRNPLIPEKIIKRAEESVAVGEQKKKPFLIVSVGRLSPEKAFHRIPQVAKQLRDMGIDFDWYLIGDGITRSRIEAEIQSTGTSDVVHLLGSRMNPYPYIRMADALVITSEYEAQPMVANEALILDTPVISTEFASVREVIQDGVNGTIAVQSIDAIAAALRQFFTDDSLRGRLSHGAGKFVYSNEREVSELYAMLQE